MKSKNLKRGGLVGEIPKDKLFMARQKSSIPKQATELMNYIKFPSSKFVQSDVFLYGSYNLVLYPYYSDLDLYNLVHLDMSYKDAVKYISSEIKNLVKKINTNDLGRHFTDMKGGQYQNGEQVHWTAKEVMKGRREGNKEDFNGHIGDKTLIEAIQEESLFKIDMIAPYFGTYTEITCVYFFSCEDGMINYKEFNTPTVIHSLAEDLKKQIKKNKLFKATKRVFAISRLVNDYDMGFLLEPLLISNVSKLSKYNSDLITLHLLISLNKKLNIQIINRELMRMKETISNINDLDLNIDHIDNSIDNIYSSILEKDKEKSLNEIEDLHEYFSDIINRETDGYLVMKGVSLRDVVSRYLN